MISIKINGQEILPYTKELKKFRDAFNQIRFIGEWKTPIFKDQNPVNEAVSEEQRQEWADLWDLGASNE